MYERKVGQGYKPYLMKARLIQTQRHVPIEYKDPIIEKIEHIVTNPSYKIAQDRAQISYYMRLAAISDVILRLAAIYVCFSCCLFFCFFFSSITNHCYHACMRPHQAPHPRNMVALATRWTPNTKAPIR
jgi:hypothetical protein